MVHSYPKSITKMCRNLLFVNVFLLRNTLSPFMYNINKNKQLLVMLWCHLPLIIQWMSEHAYTVPTRALTLQLVYKCEGFESQPHKTKSLKHAVTVPLLNAGKQVWISWILRYDLKMDVYYPSKCGTLKNPHCSMVMNAEHMSFSALDVFL